MASGEQGTECGEQDMASGEQEMESGEWEMASERDFNLYLMLQLSHKKLDVYQIALKLLEEVYTATKSFPKEELCVLTAQVRRAAISVCSNLAEGASRVSRAEKKRFYEISRSSLVEIDTQFEIALLQQYVQKDQLRNLEKHLESVFRMLSKMIDNIRLAPSRQSPEPIDHSPDPTGHSPNPTSHTKPSSNK